MMGWQIAFIVVGVAAAIAYAAGRESDAQAQMQVACISHGGTWAKQAWNTPPACVGPRSKP